ncbi:MAG: flagellar biosynthetic protein FliQ [Desulfovibrionaceae bacterium]|nr:flagellar biosynthetic protein FliQ [Desulfovibrionaceae bacterium]MBF0512579.1 flagellar biosynthetic protein FliQ [Desulfovibrionaceae bacterium]
MTPDMAVGLARQAIEVTLEMSLPLLGVGLAVGVTISILQTATQLQETTLAFVPKILSMFLAFLLAFPFLMDKMISYTRDLYLSMGTYIK